jgi:ribosomal protein S18 acetylase RimI-like enzyme
MAAVEYTETPLQDLRRHTHPDKAAPAELARLKNWRCLIDSRMVGHCTGDPMSGEIVGLSVDKDHRRQGIGRKLLSLVVEALRAAGATRIWVDAPDDQATPAYSFYRAVGWVPTGEHPRNGSEILELRESLRR